MKAGGTRVAHLVEPALRVPRPSASEVSVRRAPREDPDPTCPTTLNYVLEASKCSLTHLNRLPFELTDP